MCQYDRTRGNFHATCISWHVSTWPWQEQTIKFVRIPLDMCQYDRAKSKILNLWEYYLTCVNMTMPRARFEIWWKYYFTCVNMTMPRVECQICGGWRLLGMCQYDQAKSKNHVTWRKKIKICVNMTKSRTIIWRKKQGSC